MHCFLFWFLPLCLAMCTVTTNITHHSIRFICHMLTQNHFVRARNASWTSRRHSSVVERLLNTQKVAGSNPADVTFSTYVFELVMQGRRRPSSLSIHTTFSNRTHSGSGAVPWRFQRGEWVVPCVVPLVQCAAGLHAVARERQYRTICKSTVKELSVTSTLEY